MADRKEIAKDIKDQFGSSMINVKQVCIYTGRSRNYLDPILSKIPSLKKGRDRIYFVIDVARQLEKSMFS